jgi:uncharacterized membrane protein
MTLRVRAILLALLGAVLFPSCAAAYQSAPLNFCNNSAERVTVAVGYHSPDAADPDDHSLLTGPYVSKGWYQIVAGTCQTIDNPFDARYMFWFAWSKSFHNTAASLGAPSGDPADFCVSDYLIPGQLPDFTYEDENVSSEACHGKARRWLTSNKVDTWLNPNVDFTGY